LNSHDISEKIPTLLSPVAAAYGRRLERFGQTPRGVFWRGKEWQTRRFDILTKIFNQTDLEGNIRIHDFGCGYGALFDYLADHQAMRESRYLGTDISKDMIDAAKCRISDPRAHFIQHLWPTESADFTLVSGTFNMKMDANAEMWRAYVKSCIKELWKYTTRGLAFNLLASSSSPKYEGLFYVQPEDFLCFTQENMDPNAQLFIESPLPDFTIFARRR
tara:strand:+ start:2346 stop:2999 length:654 start_codon:yes stop_codon:yes gene_type:complete